MNYLGMTVTDSEYLWLKMQLCYNIFRNTPQIFSLHHVSLILTKSCGFQKSTLSPSVFPYNNFCIASLVSLFH